MEVMLVWTQSPRTTSGISVMKSTTRDRRSASLMRLKSPPTSFGSTSRWLPRYNRSILHKHVCWSSSGMCMRQKTCFTASRPPTAPLYSTSNSTTTSGHLLTICLRPPTLSARLSATLLMQPERPSLPREMSQTLSSPTGTTGTVSLTNAWTLTSVLKGKRSSWPKEENRSAFSTTLATNYEPGTCPRVMLIIGAHSH